MMKAISVTAAFLVVAVLGATTPLTARAGGPLSPTQVLTDKEVSVAARSLFTSSFELKRSATVRVEVKGVKNTDKGFDVYLMSTDEVEKISAGKKFEHFPDFNGQKVTSAVFTHEVPTGRYTVVVHNKHNLLRATIVAVKLTINP